MSARSRLTVHEILAIDVGCIEVTPWQYVRAEIICGATGSQNRQAKYQCEVRHAIWLLVSKISLVLLQFCVSMIPGISIKLLIVAYRSSNAHFKIHHILKRKARPRLRHRCLCDRPTHL